MTGLVIGKAKYKNFIYLEKFFLNTRKTCMRNLILFLIFGVLFLFPSEAFPRVVPPSFADLAEKLLPAVVNISTTQNVKRERQGERPQLPPGHRFEEFFEKFFDGPQRRGSPNRRRTSLGSGFIIDPTGIVVTNNHVIKGAEKITVVLQDHTRLEAKIIGRDTKTDLAVLSVKAEKKLPFVEFGNSDKSRVGDWVVAIGNPFGLGGTVTAGIISARGRDIGAGSYDDFIQSDASINKGNSGGPMFNLKGKVIGINTAIYSPSGGSVGIGFAIPTKLASPIIEQIKKFGRARRGWLGVRIQKVTKALAESLGLENASGALVAGVSKDGPAEKAKIRAGDVILNFDGKPIKEMRTLPRIVAETEVGKYLKVEVWRKGKVITLFAMLGEYPEEQTVSTNQIGGKNSANLGTKTVLGMTLSKINDSIRLKFKLDNRVTGVIITRVDNQSAAARMNIRPGSIIRRIGSDQKLVRTPEDVKRIVQGARQALLKNLFFLIEKDGQSLGVALPLQVKR